MFDDKGRSSMLLFRCCCVLVMCASFSVRGQSEIVDSQSDISFIDYLVEKWAPLIWLAPDEKYFPLSIDEFLLHVYPADGNGRSVSGNLPMGNSSKTLYLVTKRDLDSLKYNTSFLNGRVPKESMVPVYVIVTRCSEDTPSNQLDVFPQVRSKSKIRFHVTYWMFYPYNEGKEICLIGNIPAPVIFNVCFGKIKTFGNHVGDFEHVSVSFDENWSPDEMYLAVHDIGVYYKYDAVSKIFRFSRELSRKRIMQKANFPPVVRTFNDRPVLYAAKGSHGLWSAPGDHIYLRFAKLYDRNGHGMPWETWRKLEIYHADYQKPPDWMKYLGKWGNPKMNCFPSKKLGICELSDGPNGIFRQRQDFHCK